MKAEIGVCVGGVSLALSGLVIGRYIDDPAFHIRAVQSGSHETVFILLALVIGFTIKDHSDENSAKALIGAVFMAVIGFLMSGLNAFENSAVLWIGWILYCFFAGSLIWTLAYLLIALKSRRQCLESDIEESS